jgi:GNAT superfamily N-acetyltransferase
MEKLLKKYKTELETLLNTKTKWEVLKDEQYVDLEPSHLWYTKENEKGLNILIRDLKGNTNVGYFKLLQMPGCCGICISTGVIVYLSYQNKGVNTLLNNFRIDIAKNLGYGILLCTDVKNNTPQAKTLDKNGWKHIYTFQNPRTTNVLNISVKELK